MTRLQEAVTAGILFCVISFISEAFRSQAKNPNGLTFIQLGMAILKGAIFGVLWFFVRHLFSN